MPRKANLNAIGAARRHRARSLTQVIPVRSTGAIPPGYVPFRVHSPSMVDKAQVLSHRFLKPMFAQADESDADRVEAYWVHVSILPELAMWSRYRVFSDSEVEGR